MTGRELSRTQRVAAARTDKYDVISSVAGGSLSEQAGALRHGLSKALTYFEPELRSVAKEERLPDPRVSHDRTQNIWQREPRGVFEPLKRERHAAGRLPRIPSKPLQRLRQNAAVDVVHSWGCHSEPSPPQRKSVLHPRHRQTKGPLMALCDSR